MPATRTEARPVPMGLRFELFVDDVATSVRFYRDTLGLTPPQGWTPVGYLPLHAGAVAIGVQHHANPPPERHFSPACLTGPSGIGVEIVIEVDDVEAAYEVAAPSAERHGGHVEPLEDQRNVGRCAR